MHVVIVDVDFVDDSCGFYQIKHETPDALKRDTKDIKVARYKNYYKILIRH